jgi:hypothetical protein
MSSKTISYAALRLMLSKTPKHFLSILAILVIFILLTGCSQLDESQVPPPVLEDAYPIDPFFQKFYEQMGGAGVLGPPISSMFSYGGRKFQYTEAACLEYNAVLPPSQAFRLSSLGLDMGISDPPVTPPGDPNVLYIDGHTISGEFARFYHKMGGARFVGRPLTEMHFNITRNRFEQYFENVGFYWNIDKPPEEIKLLAYGAWKCDVYCRRKPVESAVVELPFPFFSTDDNPFLDAVSRLGPDFTGFPLTAIYTTSDGSLEQIYENMVLFSRTDTRSRVSLRPLTNMLGILPTPLQDPLYMQDMFFYPIEGNQGYNVPQAFLDYITMHGGIEISGPPIGEIFLIDNIIWRQCFTNLCLEYHMNPNLPPHLRINPQALGYQYRELIAPPLLGDFEESQDLNSITLQVWERHPVIAPTTPQEIAVGVFEGITPLLNIEPVLYVDMPDGSLRTYQFPPTGPDGYSYIRLAPIEAQHGSLVPYQVCLSSLLDELICVRDSFLIWYDQ